MLAAANLSIYACHCEREQYTHFVYLTLVSISRGEKRKEKLHYRGRKIYKLYTTFDRDFGIYMGYARSLVYSKSAAAILAGNM